MYIVKTKTRQRGEPERVNISTGFHSRAEAGRFASGLSKTGRADSVEISFEPDETVVETLRRWFHTYDRIPDKTRTPANEGLRRDIRLALIAFEGDSVELLKLASDRLISEGADCGIDSEKGTTLFEIREVIENAIANVLEWSIERAEQ